MKRILVTNDDGIGSIGLRILFNSVRSLGTVYVVAPEGPKSAVGLSLTLHKPLRVLHRIKYAERAWVVSGTPSDCIHIGIEKIIGRKPDLVLSGINLGDNTSIQVILASGTVGAAMQSAIIGIPSIAFSTAIDDPDRLERSREYVRIMSRFVRRIVEWVLENGMPEDVKLLNVNFPPKLSEDTKAMLTRPALMRFKERIIERRDPRGRPYYWIYGTVLDNPRPGTDVYAVWVENKISITPISINLQAANTEFFKPLEKRLNE